MMKLFQSTQNALPPRRTMERRIAEHILNYTSIFYVCLLQACRHICGLTISQSASSDLVAVIGALSLVMVAAVALESSRH